jgi:heme a synthase
LDCFLINSSTQSSVDLWPHRLALVLACATFPLIWVGGLVTTYDAGMAAPDWPTTYGYNVFLYPWQTWVSGPWNLFIEHGHRLLAAGVVGPVMLALAAVVYFRESRSAVRWLTWAAAGGVVFQAVLGGLRVRLDARLLAQIHGCVGPAFFALAAALAVVTSRRWAQAAEGGPAALPVGARLPRIATITAALAYLQIVIGSEVRHIPVTADAMRFRLAVLFHLVVAAALVAHGAMVWWRAEREARANPWLLRPARLLLVLMAGQLVLGAGTWVVNYGWPAWLGELSTAAEYVISRQSPRQAVITTAHVAMGSLILVSAVVTALRAWRMAAVSASQASTSSRVTSSASPVPDGGTASTLILRHGVSELLGVPELLSEPRA